jgi:NADPH:quinone reductase-like Zn-dependent oxidoreductase
MRAITVDKYGATPALTEMPQPHAGPGELLIKVHVAGMNPIDRKIADGAMAETAPAQFPLVLGSDLVGVVESVGEGACRFSPGEELFGELPLGLYGTYAEYVAVSENLPLALLPKGLDRIVAAALPTPGVAALQIVESLGQLAGKTVLIFGAAGGVGSFATQLAAKAGATVVAVDRAANAERLRSYGAVETVDSASVPVADVVHRTHPDGIDVLVDLVSDATGFDGLAALVRPGGTALTTRYVADKEALALRGVAAINFRITVTTEALEQIGNLVAQGRVVVPPITVIALDEVIRPSGATPTTGKTVIML